MVRFLLNQIVGYLGSIREIGGPRNVCSVAGAIRYLDVGGRRWGT